MRAVVSLMSFVISIIIVSSLITALLTLEIRNDLGSGYSLSHLFPC